MNDPIYDKVLKWDAEEYSSGGNKYTQLNRKITHLYNKLFFDYEPNLGPGNHFFTRLNKWLENLESDEDRKILFELIPNIFYVGREELNVLYREAYITNYSKWLFDILGLGFEMEDPFSSLNKGVSETWFCPLTDSFRINQFYHINNIPAKNDLRPDWRSLRHFGSVEKIRKYLETNKLDKIVLLEDFVGNGGQVSKAIEFVAENFVEYSILVVPLIICPEGVKNANNFASQHKNVKISPVLSLNDDVFIHYKQEQNQNDFFKKVSALALASYPLVSNSDTIPEGVEPDPYGPFGWRKTGGIVVLHTNTPNNSLPLIHNKSDTWEPLFKRHKRI